MYRAPLRELRFVLHELIGDGRLARLPGFADYSEEVADSVLEQAGRFAEEILAPINRSGDLAGARWTAEGVQMPAEFKKAYAQYAADGWTQLRAPSEEGGQGAPAVLGTAVEELWASANLAFKLCPMLSQAAIEAIHRCGTPEQKALYLPKLVSGEWTGTMNLTESQAGSDLGAIKSRAVPDSGGHYRVFGQKIFITYGDHDYTPNIIHLVLARIEGAPAGTKGISMFIVPKVLVNADGTLGERNDVKCVSIEHKLGIHASPTCVLSYGDRDGAIGYLVGEPNRGLEYMFIMMNAARLAVGLEGYALGERAYQQALGYARERVQGKPTRSKAAATDKGLPIVHHPDVKRMLLTMKAYTDAARAIALYASLQLDLAKHDEAGGSSAALLRGELLIPIVKGWSTETGLAMTSVGIQVHGGMGFIEETGAAQHLRDARITTIYEGTTGIQANDLVGRKLGRDGGETLRAFVADVEAELKALPSTDAGVARAVRSTLAAVSEWRDVSEALVRSYREAPERALAVAVPYLMLCGVVIGAWLMAKSYEIAARKSAEDPTFYGSKRQIARAYLDHVLPEAAALARTVGDGAGSILDADPALF